MRGLKLAIFGADKMAKVAPYVGAWIETRTLPSRTPRQTVAPYVGAWIETKDGVVAPKGYSRTLRGCVD